MADSPSPPRIALLVEDSEVNRKLMTRSLESLGFQVTEAKNGREAVTKFVDGRFDIVLMDVQMPVMDGIAATQIIRQHESSSGQHTPIIAVTGASDRSSCIDAGMDDYLFKPVSSEALEQAVRRTASSGSSS